MTNQPSIPNSFLYDLSIVIPIYNEQENIIPLVNDVIRELDRLNLSSEIILVNDGSNDQSASQLDLAANHHPRVKILHFEHNCGQTLAIAAGIHESRGKIIVLMDGDRQNDPSDIGVLIRKLQEGYDCVSGWRKNRQDSGVRRWPSILANQLIQKITGLRIHDLGCTLKAYRAGTLNPRELFGEMHRFLPVLVHARGGKVTELEVQHHPRRTGTSKYGLNRTARVISDLFLIQLLLKYPTRPSHFFAKIAQSFLLTGTVFFLFSMLIQVIWKIHWFQTGFTFLAICAASAFIIAAIGWCSELIMRNRFWLSDTTPWKIKRRVGWSDR